MKEIEPIRKRYLEIAAILNAPEEIAKCCNSPQDFGHAHIEETESGYRYVVTERGQRFDERITNDPDEILYWLVSDMTANMAVIYELNHRDASRDFRRIYFAKQIELIEKINGEWAKRKEAEFKEILKRHPFVDR